MELSRWRKETEDKLQEHLPFLLLMTAGSNEQGDSAWHKLLKALAKVQGNVDTNEILPKHLEVIILAWKGLKRPEIDEGKAYEIIERLDKVPLRE